MSRRVDAVLLGDKKRRREPRDAAEVDKTRQAASWRIARIASRQRGLVSTHQLLEAGLSQNAIEYRTRAGELHRVHRGVYLVGHAALAPLAREAAAVLAVGERATLGHASAACLWIAAHETLPRAVDIVVVGNAPRSRRGINIHRTNRLDARDVRSVDGVRLTSPARTVIDLASTAFPRLEAMFAEMQARKLLAPVDVLDAMERADARRGAPALRGLAEAAERGFTRSEAERKLRALVREARLPAPLTNARAAGYEVDFLWRDQRLIVEVDGYSFHGTRSAFERDRRKDMTLAAAGYSLIRVTWRQLTREPHAVVAAIASALAAASRATEHRDSIS